MCGAHDRVAGDMKRFGLTFLYFFTTCFEVFLMLKPTEINHSKSLKHTVKYLYCQSCDQQMADFKHSELANTFCDL